MAASPAVRQFFSFPDPVNEVAARSVAGGVAILAIVTIATGWKWLLVPLAYGFVARVLTGPTMSPWGQVVTRLLVPRLPFAAKPVSGPPKRFAQGMGVVFTVTALVLVFGFDQWTAARVVLGLLVAAAILESVFAYCLGCKVFGLLMRFGIIPPEVCERCNDIWSAKVTQHA